MDLIRKCKNILWNDFEFAFYDDGQSVEVFFVSSDLDSDKSLYHVSLNDWLRYIDFISSDDISELHAVKTEKGIRYKKVRMKL